MHAAPLLMTAEELLANPNARTLGHVLAAGTGFTLERSPDTVRAPDVAFIGVDRWPATEPPGFAELAPDLAVEVLSPSDRLWNAIGVGC